MGLTVVVVGIVVGHLSFSTYNMNELNIGLCIIYSYVQRITIFYKMWYCIAVLLLQFDSNNSENLFA